jgi:hypothetical protein
VTHVQPAGNGKNTLRYLARYVTKSALGRERILADDERGVTFNYFPNGSKKPRVMTPPAHDFIRRVLQHALPKGFKRVRYYGWLHPAAKKRLMLVQNLLAVPLRMNPEREEKAARPERTCGNCGGTAFLAPVRLKRMRLSLGELLALRRNRPGKSPPAPASLSAPSRAPPGRGPKKDHHEK